MNIPSQEVEHIAKLARLALTEQEMDLYGNQLGQILDYIDKLKELNTENVQPTSHAIAADSAKNLREDKSSPSEIATPIIALAPQREGRFIKVKKVLE